MDRFRQAMDKPLAWVTMADLQAYAEQLGEGGRKPATQNRALTAIKSLLAFGQETGYVPFNVGAAVKLRPNPDGLAQRILEESEVAKLIDQAPPGRDQLLLRLLYMSGVRVSELAQLKWCDLMPRAEAGQITVFGKGGKTRHSAEAEDLECAFGSPRRGWSRRSRLSQSERRLPRCIADPADCVRGGETREPAEESVAPLASACARQSRARSQRADPPGTGDAPPCVGFDDRPVPACAADRILLAVSAGVAFPFPLVGLG